MFQINLMKKRNKLVLAGALGLLTFAGYLLIKRYGNTEDFVHYYNDFQNLFDSPDEEDSHGIEYFSMR